MGCGPSKVDDLPLVTLCKERRDFIKTASHHRYALAASHVAYFQSLKNIGDALRQFVDEELVIGTDSPGSPVLTLPSDQGKKKKSKKLNDSSSTSISLSHSPNDDDDDIDIDMHDSHLHLSSDSDQDSGSGHIHIHDHTSPEEEQEQQQQPGFYKNKAHTETQRHRERERERERELLHQNMAKKDQRMSETEEEETEAESMSESESGSEEQKQESKGGGIDYIMSLPDVPRNLPPHVELQRTRVFANIDAPTHTDSIQYSGAFASVGLDNSFRLDQFRNNFRVEVIRFSDDGMDMEFDMIGIDPAIANAFRRILIAEVPTMAIEKVFIANNTSLIQDEVLAHRLGLIPISVDPRLFEYAENNAPNERNTIVFKLHVQCAKNLEEEKGQSKKKKEEKKVPPRITVKAKDLKWLPKGSEFYLESEDSNSNSTSKSKTYTSFTCSQDSLPEFSNNKIGFKEPLDDINIARLGPGQEIELEAQAVKGVGKTHAKWSPVATAWYRMLPEVVLLEEIEDEDAETLKEKCPVGVFDIEDIANGRKRLTVARPRACTLCRECIRGGEEWEKRVSLRRVKDHFIFTIESTGALPPEVLFTEAVKILESKCERVISELS